jgi:hypothetical protein
MRRTQIRNLGLGASLAILLAAPLAWSQPSTNLDDYAILAETKLKSKGLSLACGNVGVNQPGGSVKAPKTFSVPGQLVADIAKLGPDVVCGELFANLTIASKPATPWTPPIFADLAAACGFPNPFPVCDLANPVTVDAGTTTNLPPGTYGNLRVKGGIDSITLLPNPGVLVLEAGSYTFCDVKLSKFGEVRFTDPATVNVAGNLRMQRSNIWGAADGSGVAPSDITVFVNGPKVHYSRGAQVEATLCAPSAKCRLTKGGSHAGRVYCTFVRTEEVFFNCGSPSGAFLD